MNTRLGILIIYWTRNPIGKSWNQLVIAISTTTFGGPREGGEDVDSAAVITQVLFYFIYLFLSIKADRGDVCRNGNRTRPCTRRIVRNFSFPDKTPHIIIKRRKKNKSPFRALLAVFNWSLIDFSRSSAIASKIIRARAMHTICTSYDSRHPLRAARPWDRYRVPSTRRGSA